MPPPILHNLSLVSYIFGINKALCKHVKRRRSNNAIVALCENRRSVTTPLSTVNWSHVMSRVLFQNRKLWLMLLLLWRKIDSRPIKHDNFFLIFRRYFFEYISTVFKNKVLFKSKLIIGFIHQEFLRSSHEVWIRVRLMAIGSPPLPTCNLKFKNWRNVDVLVLLGTPLRDP